MSRPVAIPNGAWPLEMRAETAAAYCDEPSVEAFLKRCLASIPSPRGVRDRFQNGIVRSSIATLPAGTACRCKGFRWLKTRWNCSDAETKAAGLARPHDDKAPFHRRHSVLLGTADTRTQSGLPDPP